MSQNKKMPGAGTPGDNRNTNTQKEETIMSILTGTPASEQGDRRTAFERAFLEASSPVEVGSKRWHELNDSWGRFKFFILDERNEADYLNIGDYDPEELGLMYAEVFGPESAVFRPVAPAWASNRTDETISRGVEILAESGNPMVTWTTEDLVDTDGVVAAVTREDVYDVENDRIVVGELRLSVFTPEPFVIKDQYAARRIARQLLEAADAYSLIQATEKP